MSLFPETLRITRSHALTDPFVVAGSRAYLVGAQDGSFPDRGFHIPGEMGGVWAPPLKLLDGIWLQVDGDWLPAAVSYTGDAFSATQEYVLASGLQVRRLQFVPDGEPAVILRYSLRSPVDRSVAVRLLARTDLRLVWSRDLADPDGRDEAIYHEDLHAWEGRNRATEGHVFIGAVGMSPDGHSAGDDLWGPEQTSGNGISVTLDHTLQLQAHTERFLDIVVAGCLPEQGEAEVVFSRVTEHVDDLWEARAERFRSVLGRSRIAIPDPAIQESWDWIKCAYDWLDLEVPGLGRGLVGGLDDYPWWFGCDGAYGAVGALPLGRADISIRTLDLIREASERTNGGSRRVIHELTTRGEVAHLGNLEETPLFVWAVWQTYLWSGDREFLERQYDFCRRGLLDWTLSGHSGGGDLLPYGFGITEQIGLDLQCIDVAAYTLRALHDLRAMAGCLGDGETARQCAQLAAAMQASLEESFWIEEEGIYGDMLATPEEMAPRLRAWLDRPEGLYYESGERERDELSSLLRAAEDGVQGGAKRPWLLKHWVVITPLETGMAGPKRAQRVLDRVEGPEFTGPHGMYLSGMDRTHAMSINTGALAVAEATYGRPDRAIGYIRTIARALHAGMPGGISEMLPDYGCFVQAWSGYAMAWPIVTSMFGVQPDAGRKTLVLEPRFPESWTEASLDSLVVGTCTFWLRWDGTAMHVRASEDGWSVTSTSVPVRLETVAGEPAHTSHLPMAYRGQAQ